MYGAHIMATIDISRDHQLGLEKAKAAAEGIAEKLKEKVQVDYRWQGNDLVFDRSGAKGSIVVSENNVRVQIDLGMMLRPMKGMIESKVNEYLDKSLV